MFGHDEVSCRKKIGLRTAWGPIEKDTPWGNMSERTVQLCKKQKQNIQEGNTQVTKRTAAH